MRRHEPSHVLRALDDLKDCLLILHQKVTKVSFRAVESSVRGQTDPASELTMGITSFLGGIAMFPHMARVMFRVVRSAGPEFETVHEQMMARFTKLVLEGVGEQLHLRRPREDARRRAARGCACSRWSRG